MSVQDVTFFCLSVSIPISQLLRSYSIYIHYIYLYIYISLAQKDFFTYIVYYYVFLTPIVLGKILLNSIGKGQDRPCLCFDLLFGQKTLNFEFWILVGSGSRLISPLCWKKTVQDAFNYRSHSDQDPFGVLTVHRDPVFSKVGSGSTWILNPAYISTRAQIMQWEVLFYTYLESIFLLLSTMALILDGNSE